MPTPTFLQTMNSVISKQTSLGGDSQLILSHAVLRRNYYCHLWFLQSSLENISELFRGKKEANTESYAFIL